MKEYEKVITFRYKGTLYNLYLDENNRRFFLKVNDDGTLSYISLDKTLELSKIYTGDPDVLLSEYEAKKIKFIPKVISGGITVILTSTLLSGCGLAGKTAQNNISTNDNEEISQEYNQEDNNSNQNDNSNQNLSENDNSNQNNMDEGYDYSYILDYSMQDKNRAADDLECHFTNPDGSVVIFDKKDLDPRTSDIDDLDLLSSIKQDVTYDDLLGVIDENKTIPEKFKPYLQEYCLSFCQKYPNANKSTFYENLKTLKIKEVNQTELGDITNKKSIGGSYLVEENTIYLVTENNPTWDEYLFYHEVSHAVVTGSFDNGKIKTRFDGRLGSNACCKEALNTLFALSLMPYKVDNYSYKQVTNYYKAMLDCMDDYSLEDYVNHNADYFLNKLNKAAGNNYAPKVMDLITTQYKAKIDPDMEASEINYKGIYDYISNLYYGKFITPDMTYQEAKEVADDLVATINNEIGTGGQVNTERFYKNLDRYCDQIGIQKNVKTR